MIAIIQYNAGNTGSVQHALRRLGCESVVTDDPDIIRKADKVILPGVGEAGTAMASLRRSGLAEVIPTLTMPVLGICLGLQLLCEYSEEGDTVCMGIFDTAVKRFPPGDTVPHTGWNSLDELDSLMFAGLDPMANDVYFVHSYYAEVCAATVATCRYIIPFSASLQQGNFFATQFHPEKSSAVGEAILKNFLAT